MGRNKNSTTNFKVFELKIKNINKQYFEKLFLEAKWLSNSVIAAEDIFQYCRKVESVDVLVKDKKENRQLKIIRSCAGDSGIHAGEAERIRCKPDVSFPHSFLCVFC